jgi:hypothetical protein
MDWIEQLTYAVRNALEEGVSEDEIQDYVRMAIHDYEDEGEEPEDEDGEE